MVFNENYYGIKFLKDANLRKDVLTNGEYVKPLDDADFNFFEVINSVIDEFPTTVYYLSQNVQALANNLEADMNLEMCMPPSLFLLNKSEFIYCFITESYIYIVHFYPKINNIQSWVCSYYGTLNSPEILTNHSKAYKLIQWMYSQKNETITVNNLQKIKLNPEWTKVTEDNNSKIYNSSGLNITMVNSYWQKTLIHDEPFPVSGFWRKQRVGRNKQEIKKIFIRPFIKKGYKRTYNAINN